MFFKLLCNFSRTLICLFPMNYKRKCVDYISVEKNVDLTKFASSVIVNLVVE